MESEDPLSQLADIHLPDPVSIWPLAPGWWLLIALALLFLIWLSYKALRRLMLHKRLQSAQHELNKAIATYRAATKTADCDLNKAGLDYLYAVNTVLNRVALFTDNKQQRKIARLSGTPWLDYLDQSYGGNEFSEGLGKVLAEGQYRPIFAAEVEGLYTLSQAWISSRYTQNSKLKVQNKSKSNIEVLA